MTEQHRNNQVIEAAQFDAPTGQQDRAQFRVTGTHISLLILAVLCLAFIAFISLARSIQINAVAVSLTDQDKRVPQSADVSIETRFKLPIGNRVLLMPGKHNIRIIAAGFEPLSQTLSVEGERHQQFELLITRLPGKLNIPLPDGVQATLMLDDKPFADLPGLVEEVPAGKHVISIDAKLYRPFSQSIVVKGKGETQDIQVDLQPAWAEYSFTTSPAGAAIVVDGQSHGVTPATVRVEEGSHSLSLQAAGFKAFEKDLSVVANENIVVPTVSLIPADGVLTLASEPAGAAVILESEFKGVTPMTLAIAPNVTQQLQVYKAGYQLEEQAVTLAPDQREAQSLNLNPDLIRVKLSVSPKDAAVYVDGVKRGTGSQTLSLNTLPHSISVRKSGYVTKSQDVVPTRASKQILSFKLLTNEQHYWAQIPAKYTNRLGHEMKLFRSPGNVKMGSSRREDGRRANEVSYQAELTKPFYVALHETTNKQFRQFKATHNAGNYKKKSLDANKAPAANISWQDAARYCNWLSKREGLDPFYQTTSGYISGMRSAANGYRLLTEVEWAWLARNTKDGTKTYPWGTNKSVQAGRRVGNFADVKAQSIIAFTLEGYDDGFKGPSPVGRFPENHRGLFDMGGNVAEWVNDWYSSKGSSELSRDGVVKDPLGPEIGEFHVVRGASWARGHLPQLRLAYRDYGAKGKHDIGFRVARYAGLNKSKKSAVLASN